MKAGENFTTKELFQEVWKIHSKINTEFKEKNKMEEKILKNMSKELREDVTELGRDITKIAVKLSYPLTGNLSDKLRDGIESMLGEEYFNPEKAAEVSLWTNATLYSLSAGYGIYSTSKHDLGSALYVGCLAFIIFGCLDAIPRVAPKMNINIKDRTHGSVIGKIFSLPLEYAMNLYERAKKMMKTLTIQMVKINETLRYFGLRVACIGTSALITYYGLSGLYKELYKEWANNSRPTIASLQKVNGDSFPDLIISGTNGLSDTLYRTSDTTFKVGLEQKCTP